MRRVLIASLAAVALLFGGVAVAQETAPTDDPQTMCEAAGGEWDGSTCFNVWCGWEDDPAICEWMASQSPTGAEPAQPAQPVEPAPSVSSQTGGTGPSYTG
jgi:hypothetical protein